MISSIILRHCVTRGEFRSRFRTCKHADAGAVQDMIRDIMLDYQREKFEERKAQSPVGKGESFDLFFILGEYDFA